MGGSSNAGRKPLALLQLGAGMALFGSATPVSKLVGEAVPAFTGSSLRVAVGALVLLPFAAGSLRGLSRIDRRTWGVVALVALFGMFGFSLLMLYGMRLVPGVVGSIVMSTTPAVTALASILFLGDAIGWRKATAVGLAVVGVVVANLGGGGAAAAGGALIAGSALVFLAVCCESAYTLLGKVAMEQVSPLLLTVLAAALSLPLFLPFAAAEVAAVDWGGLGWAEWAAIAWWGGGTMGLGSLLWYSGVSKVSGSTAAGFMGVMPVSALVLSYVLLGEPLRWSHLAGFAIVFAGVLLIVQVHRREAE